MGTLILCSVKDCIHGKPRTDKYYQCQCTTLYFTEERDCGSYFCRSHHERLSLDYLQAESKTTTNKKEA